MGEIKKMFVNFDPKINKTESAKKSKKTSKTGGGFLSSLFGAEIKNKDEDIAKLIDEVDDASDELKRERSFIAFEKYKKRVKRLVDSIVEKNNIVKNATGKNMLGQKKLYLIKSINEELDSMTKKIVQEQDLLYVINKIEDVRGMLVDTYTD